MNKLTFFTVVIIHFSINIFSQTDNRWLVKDGHPKTTVLVPPTTDVYGYDQLSQIGAAVQISGISIASDLNDCYGVPPTNTPCDYGTPGKDIFIIFENGNHFNSRGTNICDAAWWSIASNSSTISCINTIKYLYLTNIYQGDDPPEATFVSNITSSPPTNVAVYSEPDILTANHDIVRNNDYTIIIPRQLFDTCKSFQQPSFSPNIKLEIGQAIDDNSALHPILTLRNVFSSATQYSFHNLYLSSSDLIMHSTNFIQSINNIPPPPAGKYHFINFNADFVYDEGLIGKTINITASCVENPTAGPWTISETIRDLHDPNKIEVKCVFKKRKCFLFGTYRYYVKYLVEFFNDGPTLVDWVDVELTMPSCALVNTITLDKWSFGGEDSCGKIDNDYFFEIDNQKITFHLSRLSGSSLAAQSVSNPPSDAQYGRFEFCVEVNQDPSNGELNLRPSQPTSSFDGVVFPIYNFIDPIAVATDSSFIRNIRSFKNCKCDCSLRQALPPLGGQQR